MTFCCFHCRSWLLVLQLVCEEVVLQSDIELLSTCLLLLSRSGTVICSILAALGEEVA